MIASYYLILTVFYVNRGTAIEKIPMQTESACQQAGLAYTTKMEERPFVLAAYDCVKTGNN